MPERPSREGFGTSLTELFPGGAPVGEVTAPRRLLRHLADLGQRFDSHSEAIHIGWSEHGLSAYASNAGNYLACLIHVPEHRCGVPTSGRVGTVAVEGEDLGTLASMARRRTTDQEGVSTRLEFGDEALSVRTTDSQYGGTMPAVARTDGQRADFARIAGEASERAIVSVYDLGYQRTQAEQAAEAVTRAVLVTDGRGARLGIWDSDDEQLVETDIDGSASEPALAAYQHEPIGELLDLVPTGKRARQYWYWDDSHPLLAWGFDEHIQVVATVAPLLELPDGTLEGLAGGEA
ncbi:hypothetical protein [Haloglomus litoreum]|uniref:hypothetical protein n=1 Tax=Haloglomus litoreum TaxID=3034026 RepID=UPI0023E8BDEE|nr:hypothetical protein [Haloglomus sp. DT116]